MQNWAISCRSGSVTLSVHYLQVVKAAEVVAASFPVWLKVQVLMAEERLLPAQLEDPSTIAKLPVFLFHRSLAFSFAFPSMAYTG